MRLHSLHQQPSKSGTSSSTKKSFPPLSRAGEAGGVEAATPESSRVADPRAQAASSSLGL